MARPPVALVGGEGGDDRGDAQDRAVQGDVLGNVEGEVAGDAGEGGEVLAAPGVLVARVLDAGRESTFFNGAARVRKAR